MRLAIILGFLSLTACSNAIPTVESLAAIIPPKEVPAKDPKNFAQLNAGSAKENLGTYKGNIRISQSLSDMNATSGGGYQLKGTVTLQR